MFCPQDKGLLRPVEGVLTCPKCGYQKGKSESMIVKGKAQDDIRKSVVIDEETAEKEKGLLPTTTDYQCEKCGGEKAYYFLRQTRAADEATTRFLECVECGHKWRDYR